MQKGLAIFHYFLFMLTFLRYSCLKLYCTSLTILNDLTLKKRWQCELFLRVLTPPTWKVSLKPHLYFAQMSRKVFYITVYAPLHLKNIPISFLNALIRNGERR